MKRFVAVALVLVCGVTAVLADTDPIAERRALMKHDGEAAEKIVRHVERQDPHSIWRR